MPQDEQRLTASVADLWRIAETNDTRALQSILSSGIDVDARNEHGTTALMRAASHGRLRMVEALIARGADPNAVRHDNFTPLTLAAFFGHTDIVRLLVQAGAEKDRVTRNGTSARMWASARTFKGVAKYLDEIQPVAKDLDESQPVAAAMDVVPVEYKTEPISTQDSEVFEVAVPVEPISDESHDDVAELAPVIEKSVEIPHQSSLFAHLSLSKISAALTVLFVMISLAAVAMLLRNDLQKIQTISVNRGTPESTVADVAPSNKIVWDSRVEEDPSESAADRRKTAASPEVSSVDEARTRKLARTSKKRFAGDNDVQAKRRRGTLKPKSAVASVPVINQAPAFKRDVSPLSTQLVSSPSNSAAKPKVIQWP